jgi:hypothetical protein
MDGEKVFFRARGRKRTQEESYISNKVEPDASGCSEESR